MDLERIIQERAERHGFDAQEAMGRVAPVAWDNAVRTYAKLYDGTIRAAQRASERGLDADGIRAAALSHIKVVWLAEEP